MIEMQKSMVPSQSSLNSTVTGMLLTVRGNHAKLPSASRSKVESMKKNPSCGDQRGQT